MSRELPARPNLDHLKKQAKELLQRFREGDSAAVELFRSFGSSNAPKLADAQHAVAREYGFETWPQLKERVQSLSADPYDAFVAAIKSDNVARAATLLRENAELKARINEPLQDRFGATLLMVAVQHANRNLIELLLRHGADINQRSDWWAGSFGAMDDAWCADWLPAFLMGHGAKLDVHAAARLGMLDELKAMISADPALVQARGGDGQTPLHFAQSIEAAEYLLAHGADIDARDVDHESTPAQYMVRGRQDVARYLVQRGCRADILMAAALGDTDLVRKYLDSDPASIRTSVSDEFFPRQYERAGGTIYIWTLGKNKTAHIIAREFHHEEIFRLLMERSPDELKLAQACELGDEPTFKALLARNPNLAKTLTEDDRRKLVNAAEANNLEAVRLLLEAGWPVDARTQGGITALHWAGFHGNVELIRVLLHCRPPIDATDLAYKATPLGWAFYGSVNGWRRDAGDFAASVEALLNAGAKLPPKAGEHASPAVREFLRQRSQRS